VSDDMNAEQQEEQSESGLAEAGRSEKESPEKEFRSGFVTFFGRPNVGKSTLLNKILGEKVTITSDKAQTTRNQVRGVLTTSEHQIVFVDTPGVGKPRSALGSRLNATAREANGDVDVVCFVVDAHTGYGRGDAFLAAQLDPERTVVVMNKVDGMSPAAVAAQLQAVSEVDASAFFPVSAQTGEGLEGLLKELAARIPIGPHWYPDEQVRDMPDARWVAELVREQLMRVTRDEVPHSVATRVTEWEETDKGPRIRVEILVERESQKGIVIGHGGEVLKKVGTNVRRQLPKGSHINLVVSVDRDWHHDLEAIERLGY
jgi:GTP-binding protein Era